MLILENHYSTIEPNQALVILPHVGPRFDLEASVI